MVRFVLVQMARAEQNMIKELWINDHGTLRQIKQVFERRNGEWVEVDMDRAAELIGKHRIRMAALWWWVAAVAFTAGATQLLLT